MKNEVKACAASIVLCGLVAPAAAQERQTMPSFSYSEGVKRGDCKIAFRATDGVTTVDFGLGITDSVFTVEVLRSNWDIGEDRDPDTSDLPLTLTFQNGQSTSSEFGGFKNGFYQGVWGNWHGKNSDPVQSQRGLERLMEATSATVSFEGETIAEVNLGPTGFAANKLVDCAIAERKKQQQ
tara:strand:- start:7 stop:549 length:543 start_codon:yes stop_codon:yes gene_type:complete